MKRRTQRYIERDDDVRMIYACHMAAAVSRAFAAFGLVYAFIACSSDGDEKGNGGMGGAYATGGLPSTGGAPTGGVTATGGVATGGVVTGGTAGAGGGPSTGGEFATGGVVGTGGAPPTPTGGVPGSGGAGSGGASSGGASSGGSTGSGGAASTNDALRASCVATINNYRASLNSGLKPLVRPNASIEACSDQGAASDAASGVAHQSAGKCRPSGAQNTCPGFPPDRTTGVEGAMKQCLSQMWAEGEPAEGRAECLRKYFAGDTQCFLAHGHYLNMSDAGNGFVSCGFFTMTNGRIWMNQDFGPGAP